jgi:hypothetical protein
MGWFVFKYKYTKILLKNKLFIIKNNFMEVVEYYKEYKDEVPFIMGGEKWVYCWGRYPDGKIDIAVYRYSTDMAYDYNDFREAMGIDESIKEKNINENMENTINEKISQLKTIQSQLDEALNAYKESIKELESMKSSLVPEVMDAFKGQTEGAEKLKISIDSMLVEVVQESEKLTTSYKDAFETALTKVNENTRKVLEQILENSKVASKVKGQLKIDGSKVFEGVAEMFGKVKEWLGRAYQNLTGFTSKAQEGVDEIEAMIKDYDEMEANKYAASNMDDIESGALREEGAKEVSERTKQTIEKWVAELGHRGGAKKLVDYFIGKMAGGLGTDDLADTATLANGLDEIEDLLKDPSDYYYAITNAKDTAMMMLDDEGFGDDMFGEGEEKTMEETKDEVKEEGWNEEGEVKEEGSFMKMRAGADGKVYEEADEKLMEAINRYKKIINY